MAPNIKRRVLHHRRQQCNFFFFFVWSFLAVVAFAEEEKKVFSNIGCDDSTHKCLNGGSCVEGIAKSTKKTIQVCDCKNAVDEDGSRYVGLHCEVKSFRRDKFCSNGGKPKAIQSGIIICICPEGYVGAYCELSKNTPEVQALLPNDSDKECNIPCMNDGICALGRRPPTEVESELHPVFDPNYHGGKESTYFYEHCLCPDGYYGTQCESTYDLCITEQNTKEIYCHNNSTCIYARDVMKSDAYDSYTSNVAASPEPMCNCTVAHRPGKHFTGRYCEYENVVTCDDDDTDMGKRNFCTNGGECKKDNNGNWSCNCPERFNGRHCESFQRDFVHYIHEVNDDEEVGNVEDKEENNEDKAIDVDNEVVVGNEDKKDNNGDEDKNVDEDKGNNEVGNDEDKKDTENEGNNKQHKEGCKETICQNGGTCHIEIEEDNSTNNSTLGSGKSPIALLRIFGKKAESNKQHQERCICPSGFTGTLCELQDDSNKESKGREGGGTKPSDSIDTKKSLDTIDTKNSSDSTNTKNSINFILLSGGIVIAVVIFWLMASVAFTLHSRKRNKDSFDWEKENEIENENDLKIAPFSTPSRRPPTITFSHSVPIQAFDAASRRASNESSTGISNGGGGSGRRRSFLNQHRFVRSAAAVSDGRRPSSSPYMSHAEEKALTDLL